jgi:membrane protease YdiL (CAAX protease family)
MGLVLALGIYLAGPIAWMLLRRFVGMPSLEGEDPAAPLTMSEMVRQAAIVYLGQAVVALVYVKWLMAADRPDPDRRFSHARAALVGAVALLLVWPIVNAVGWIAGIIVHWIRGIVPEAIAHDTLELFMESPADGSFILMGLLVVVAAPVMEEVLYRGLLQETLRRVGARPWAAITITSVLFAAMHWSNTAPHAVIGLFVLSLGFGWVYERTGRLTAAIVMHAVFNISNLALALLMR